MTHSMTAFARKEKQAEWGQIAWEVRSVNHRYLDMNIKMPRTISYLEEEVKIGYSYDNVPSEVNPNKQISVMSLSSFA